MRINLRALLTAAWLGVFTAAADAHADSKQECATAYENTQSFREAGRLVEARKEAIACSASTCLVYVVQDCKQWLTEIDNSLPTVVFALEDPAAFNLLAVRVTVDGKEVAGALDGKPVPFDPGERLVRFETAGAEPVEQKVTLQMGAKNRVLTASLKLAPSPSPPAPPAPTATTPTIAPETVSPPPLCPAPEPVPAPKHSPRNDSNRSIPIWSWFSGGAALVTLGLSAGYGANALHAQSELVTACGGDPTICPARTQAVTVLLARQRDHNRNIFFGFGATALVLVGVTVLGIVIKPSSPSRPRASVLMAPFGSPSSGGLAVQGRF